MSDAQNPGALHDLHAPSRTCVQAVDSAQAASAGLAQLPQVFLRSRFDAARAEAAASDELAQSGVQRPLAGLTLAVKACFDVAGWVTDAASAVLADQPPAEHDAPLVAALRAAGATLVAHTNMTEFAFGALGINTTTGTPTTPLDALNERVAGGSTSGGAVAVAAGLADIALGTDTSGSVRIPAAFCGIAGFKPSKGVLSPQGCIPLSTTFDVPGFIARDIGTVRRIVAALRLYQGDRQAAQARSGDLAGLRFAIPAGFATARCDSLVRHAFEEGIARLQQQGASIVDAAFSDLAAPSRIAMESGIIVADAYAWHRRWIRERAARYDPLVGPRILRGEAVPAYRYLDGLAALQQAAAVFDAQSAGYDALLMPTVPLAPPRIADLQDNDEYLRVNARVFSLTELANRIDVPSVTLPLRDAQSGSVTPYGLMLTGRRRDDLHLLSVAQRVEAALR